KPGRRDAAIARVSTTSSIFVRLSSLRTAAGFACSYPIVNSGKVFALVLVFISTFRSAPLPQPARVALLHECNTPRHRAAAYLLSPWQRAEDPSARRLAPRP